MRNNHSFLLIQKKNRFYAPNESYITPENKDNNKLKLGPDQQRCLMYVAALFDVWSPGDSKNQNDTIFSVTLLTTDATPDRAYVHFRMPVVLQTKEEVERWLNAGVYSVDDALATIIANLKMPILKILSYPTPRHIVGNTANKSVECIQKHEDANQSNHIERFFKTQNKKHGDSSKTKPKDEVSKIKPQIKKAQNPKNEKNKIQRK